jgi:ribosomal protein S17E
MINPNWREELIKMQAQQILHQERYREYQKKFLENHETTKQIVIQLERIFKSLN